MPDGRSDHLYWLIIGCEAAFWLLLALALAVRYLLRRHGLSRVLLLSLPAVDVLLLVLTALDLKSGRTASVAHGLATAYVGFTVAFGSVMVAWADAKFAHRFAGGPEPHPAPKYGWPGVRYEFALWFRSIVAWLITIVLLIGLIAFVNDEARTQELRSWFQTALGSILVWFVFGPGWSLVFFRREPAGH